MSGGRRTDEHVVLLPDGNYTMHCRHCGERYTPALPVSVDMFVAMSRAFVKSHRRCKPSVTKA